MQKSQPKIISKQENNELDYILNIPRNITQKMFYQSMKQLGIIIWQVTIVIILKDKKMQNQQDKKEKD